jgi:hypothetical protein
MAAIDTIEVLDNLQFQHLNTADIYSINAAGEAGECVTSRPIALPLSALGARILINNGYGATGSTVMARVRVTATTGMTTTTVTKTQNTQPLEWTSVALGACVESAEVDLTNVMEALVHVDVALVGTTAHLGTEIRVQVRKEESVDEWTDWVRLVVLAGLTAFTLDVASTAAAGQKVIAVNNPTAGHLNYLNKRIFVLDATAADCEVLFQTACGADS